MSKQLTEVGTQRMNFRIPKTRVKFLKAIAEHNQVTMTEIMLYGLDLVENECIEIQVRKKKK